jgi:hypothetical protein
MLVLLCRSLCLCPAADAGGRLRLILLLLSGPRDRRFPVPWMVVHDVEYSELVA